MEGRDYTFRIGCYWAGYPGPRKLVHEEQCCSDQDRYRGRVRDKKTGETPIHGDTSTRGSLPADRSPDSWTKGK